jgi:integrase/recombinase XerD
MLFDWLVTGQVVATNPAHAVRGPKHVVKTGKTTVFTGEHARELLDSIDTSTLVGLRDRALISVMTFAFTRIKVRSPSHRARIADITGGPSRADTVEKVAG